MASAIGLLVGVVGVVGVVGARALCRHYCRKKAQETYFSAKRFFVINFLVSYDTLQFSFNVSFSMDVLLAKTAGFCMGVSLALQKLDKEIEKNLTSRIVTLGSIIHNPQVIAMYKEKGVKQIKDIADIVDGDRVLIRAHGIPRHIEERLLKLPVTVLDATCPKVKRAQLGIAKMHEKGHNLLLFGEREHPEVRSLLSYADESSVVFSSPEEFSALTLLPGKKYFLAAQTTQDIEAYKKIAGLAASRLSCKPVVLHTICSATRKRLQGAIELAHKVDTVIVVGGYESGNTRRLAEAVQNAGKKAIHIEVPEELDTDGLKSYGTIGITAGASTPNFLIEATQTLVSGL